MSNEFVIERGTLERYLGREAHVVVPDKVKTIGSYAFQRQSEILSVQLPESVTKISDSAFKDCISLQSINIPGNVKTIGAEAFRNCRQLDTVTFAAVPEKIGLLAFYGCWKLAQNAPAPLQDFFTRMRTGNVNGEEGKKLYHFSKAKGVASIKEFDGVNMLAWDGSKYPYAFGNRENSLIIPVAIGDLPVVKAPSKQIPENAVVYCSGEHFDKLPRPNKAILAVQWLAEDRMLREELTEKIQTFIKKYSEDVAYALEHWEDPVIYQRFLDMAKPKAALVEKMVEQAAGKASILAVLLQANTPKRGTADLSLDAKPKMTAAELKKLWTYMTYAEPRTDEKYFKLTNYKGRDKHVVVPAAIGKTRVKEIAVTFPAQVESVEFTCDDMKIDCSFRNCTSMADADGFIVVSVGSRQILTDYIGNPNVSVLRIPEGVTENGAQAFRSLNMREVEFPEGFLSLTRHSFYDCRNLKRVILPESLRTIEQLAFLGCDALSDLYIPAGITEVPILSVHHNALTIWGHRGSAAERYAQKHDLPFREGKPE